MTGPSLSLSVSGKHSLDLRELDAARALLGVTPNVPTGSSQEEQETTLPKQQMHGFVLATSSSCDSATATATSIVQSLDRRQDDTAEPQEEEEPPIVLQRRRPRSGSEGLDYLAALAERERLRVPEMAVTAACTMASSSITLSSDDDDSEAMPPPPPRRRGRPRSVSDPEYESSNSSSRRDFMLPAAILESELAEARVAVQEQYQMTHTATTTTPPGVASIPEHAEYVDEQEEENLTLDELLRRARSRLLEDLSAESSSAADADGKGAPPLLPHSLSKYKEVYNKNGRIGVYTPQERAAILARFRIKRVRRNWNRKKIRYDCRKNLADSRLRVRGRFVKRSEQVELQKKQSDETMEGMNDQEMPDVNDPEAGFVPTEDQPYRRLRRHTIT